MLSSVNCRDNGYKKKEHLNNRQDALFYAG